MPTMTNTVNYSGMLKAKTDERTRFLDAIFARGKNGGKVTNNSLEFVLSSGYDMENPTQPNISEQAALTAPTPETTERDQEYNVHQIFQRAVEISYMKEGNGSQLDGVNVAGASNNVPSELDFQVGRRLAQMKMDLNYTILNGLYQYTKGSVTIAPKTRGIIPAIETNLFDAEGATITKGMINTLLKTAISNGADVTALEIWCNPSELDKITDLYSTLPGFNQPATRTEGGLAITTIVTPFGTVTIDWDPMIPEGTLLFVNMGALALSEKPVPGKGTLFYEELAKVGAGSRGQLYGEMGLDYSNEWGHAVLTNIA